MGSIHMGLQKQRRMEGLVRCICHDYTSLRLSVWARGPSRNVDKLEVWHENVKASAAEGIYAWKALVHGQRHGHGRLLTTALMMHGQRPNSSTPGPVMMTRKGSGVDTFICGSPVKCVPIACSNDCHCRHCHVSSRQMCHDRNLDCTPVHPSLCCDFG